MDFISKTRILPVDQMEKKVVYLCSCQKKTKSAINVIIWMANVIETFQSKLFVLRGSFFRLTFYKITLNYGSLMLALHSHLGLKY
ncbi:hypothetical protein XELAEV_18031273mg [Xenopus laevis]|uniref:Uncharacterized protein n=1 Tax=Xenopus laevis TaxID=8355 RepID=A0A974HFJ8_XENLA|nr:hypothetical protein XELAEV_18031273mg [Xenopus laevis]